MKHTVDVCDVCVLRRLASRAGLGGTGDFGAVGVLRPDPLTSLLSSEKKELSLARSSLGAAKPINTSASLLDSW